MFALFQALQCDLTATNMYNKQTNKKKTKELLFCHSGLVLRLFLEIIHLSLGHWAAEQVEGGTWELWQLQGTHILRIFHNVNNQSSAHTPSTHLNNNSKLLTCGSIIF